MAVFVPENSTIAEHIQCRRPRNPPISEPYPNPPQIPTHFRTLSEHIQSTRFKSTISSLLFSTFTATTTTTDTTPTTPKKKKFASRTLRGLGCAASAHVSVPAAIRTSANWESENVKKKKKQRKKNKAPNEGLEMENEPDPLLESVSVVGIAATEADVSDDCVVSRRPISGRAKFEVNQRERPSFSARRMVNPEPTSFMDSDHSFVMTHSGLDVFGARYHRHVRYPSPDGLEEIIMLRSSLLMGGRSDVDRYRDWRLDVDSMSYEELLELGDRIGYANTGLKEDEIVHCLRKIKLSDDLSSHFPEEMEFKCSICQEDYEVDVEMGKLECGHFYHIHCIRQWLARKNTCPVCKKVAAS